MPSNLSQARMSAIRVAALAMAERASGQYRADLLHIASDAQAAVDGCPASLESVLDFIAADHELWMASLSDEAVARPANWTLAA